MPVKASNSSSVRHYNERVVLDLIRRAGETSKAEIARHANLTPPAAAGIVDALVEGGYVEEKGKRFGGKGKPSVIYSLAPAGAFSIGIHIGRRAFDVVMVDFLGQVKSFQSEDYDFPDPARIRPAASEVVRRFRAQLGSKERERFVGAGISAPYFIGGWDNELAFPAGIREAWRSVDLARSFIDLGTLPVLVENDASAAALSELVFGVGRETADFLHISINTFVGAGLVLNGTLQTGPNGNTAAFGPFPVTASSLSTVPPPRGKFEVLLHRASIFTLIRHLTACGVPIGRAQQLETMDPRVRALVSEWQDDCADALAQAIIGSIAVVDVEVVVVDGQLPPALLADTIDRISRAFREALPSGLIEPRIVAGSFGARGSAIGASQLPIYARFGPDAGVLMKRAIEKKPLMVGSLSGRP